MKVNFRKLVTRLSKEDNVVGDLCKDLLIDRDFNWRWGLAKKREYIFNLPCNYGSHLEDAVELFLEIFDELYKDELPDKLENFRDYLREAEESYDCECDEESHDEYIAMRKEQIGFDSMMSYFTNE